MFQVSSWLRRLFGSKTIDAAVRQVDAEVDAFVDERFAQVISRMKARIELRLTDLQREPAVDVEWEPAVARLTLKQDGPVEKLVVVQRRKTRKPVTKVVKRGRKAKRAA